MFCSSPLITNNKILINDNISLQCNLPLGFFENFSPPTSSVDNSLLSYSDQPCRVPWLPLPVLAFNVPISLKTHFASGSTPIINSLDSIPLNPRIKKVHHRSSTVAGEFRSSKRHYNLDKCHSFNPEDIKKQSNYSLDSQSDDEGPLKELSPSTAFPSCSADIDKRAISVSMRGTEVRLTRSQLEEVFHLPQSEACHFFGMQMTKFKQVLRENAKELGIPTWPFRKVQHLDALKAEYEGRLKRLMQARHRCGDGEGDVDSKEEGGEGEKGEEGKKEGERPWNEGEEFDESTWAIEIPRIQSVLRKIEEIRRRVYEDPGFQVTHFTARWGRSMYRSAYRQRETEGKRASP